MLKRRLLTDLGELERLRPKWEALLPGSSADEPAHSPDWMLAWWSVFGGDGGRKLRVLALREGDELVGVVPLLSRAVSVGPGISVHRLEPLGSGEAEADEICSDYLGVVADRRHERGVVEAFVDAAVDGQLGDWDEMVLPSMDGGSRLPSMLTEALERRGIGAAIVRETPSPYVPLAGSWDAYLAALPPRRRYLVRRSLRDFGAWAGAPPQLTFARTIAEVERAWAALQDLHAERWAAAGRPGVFASSRFREFHERLMPAFLARGALDLGTLDVRGKPVAAFYNFVWREKSYFYQSGRTLDVPRSMRLGIVMHACLIRDAAERGLREYDFLGGGSRYKQDLALAERSLVTLRAARPSVLEAARRAAEIVVDGARRLRSGFARARGRKDVRVEPA